MQIVGVRKEGDCGIAALASYLHLAYEDVYAQAVRVNPRAPKHGILVRDLIKVAASFGRTLVIVRRPDLDQDCGVLGINWSRSSGHFVVLRRGQVFEVNPPGAWDLDEYLAARRSCRPGWPRTGWLLTEER